MMSQVASEEDVARLLHRTWLIDGQLQSTAFALNEGETYLSVNRTSIESYNQDVNDFLSNHQQYKTADDSEGYRRALLNVGAIRGMNISFEQEIATLSVEVEPRDSHYKSHAGIFIRVDGNNLKGGMPEEIKIAEDQVVSASSILQKVRMSLLRLSKLESCCIVKD